MAFMPAIAAWVVGTIIGIDLIFGGGSLIAMAVAARRQHYPSHEPA